MWLRQSVSFGALLSRSKSTGWKNITRNMSQPFRISHHRSPVCFCFAQVTSFSSIHGLFHVCLHLVHGVHIHPDVWQSWKLETNFKMLSPEKKTCKRKWLDVFANDLGQSLEIDAFCFLMWIYWTLGQAHHGVYLHKNRWFLRNGCWCVANQTTHVSVPIYKVRRLIHTNCRISYLILPIINVSNWEEYLYTSSWHFSDMIWRTFVEDYDIK